MYVRECKSLLEYVLGHGSANIEHSHRACAWCGEVANSMCTACEQPLCTLAARGSRSGRDCHALYHEPLCVGLAKADVVKKRNAGGKGKEFSKPTVSQIKRYARKKQRDLEGDE